MKKFFFNFLNSINGLKVTLKQHSFIAEIVGGLILIPYLIIADLDNIFKLIIIVIYFLLLAFELLNTAIEKLSDKISKDFDTDIKKIKDISSAFSFYNFNASDHFANFNNIFIIIFFISLIIIKFLIILGKI